jgi:cytochrome c oxidase subunit 2
MFENITQYGNTVDFAMAYIVGISIIMLIGVTLVMVFFVIKYDYRKHTKPKQTHGSIYVESVWIVLPTLLVISMFYVGWTDFSELRKSEQWDEEVQVMAQKWLWRFEYDNGKKIKTQTIIDLENDKVTDVYIPKGKKIKFILSGDPADVIHSFYIPAFRMKEDVVPGRETFVFVTPEIEGTYTLFCTEYCGDWHSRMYANVHVVPEDEYIAWKNEGMETKEDNSEMAESNSEQDHSNETEHAEVSAH